MSGSGCPENAAALRGGNGNREWPQIVKLMNGVLREWQANTLPEFLQRSSPGLLAYLGVKLAESLPRYDLLIKESRVLAAAEAHGAAARDGAAPSSPAFEEALRLAPLWEERKAILSAILSSVKQAVPLRASMGG